MYLGTNKDGKRFELEPFHTLFTGQTNLSGKTTTVRALLPEAVDKGYTVLAFDTKPGVDERELPGYTDIPVCYQDTLDTLVLLQVLESIRHARLGKYYSTLGKMLERTQTMGDVIVAADKLKDPKKGSKSAWERDAAWEISDLLKRLKKQLENTRYTKDLELVDHAINVMPLNQIPKNSQQLIIKTCFEQVLTYRSPLIVYIDEMNRFLPQDYDTACKEPIQDMITQTAKRKKFVWGSTQFLATTEKDPLKAMPNKLLGRQDHPTEQHHTIDMIPDGKVLFKPSDIAHLKRGEFIYVPVFGEPEKIYIDLENRKQYVPPPASIIIHPGEAVATESSVTIDTDTGKSKVNYMKRVDDDESLTDAEYRELHERLLVLETKASSG